ncbi:hypothetical protein BU17DRAFT_72754 [Hysterangium stoloniferum]|nr:hypothetical protein BU17DRAFT_72754 [Hysterangium stoloniferum]
MPVTRSTGGQGPYVTVIVSLSVLKKIKPKRGSCVFRYEKHKMGVVRKPRTSRPQPKAILVPQPPKKTKNTSTTIITSDIITLNDAAEPDPKAAEKRALLLLFDPDVVSVEEQRLLCAGCVKWVPLQDKYCLKSWRAHAATCRPLAERRPPPTKPDPHDRLKHRTEEERAELLRRDPRCHTVEERRVLCALCGLWIKLRNNTTYCPPRGSCM